MKNIYKLTLIIIVIFSVNVNSQIGIGTAVPNSSTLVDVVSNDKGFLGPQIPLLSRTDKTTIPNPVNGLLVYNTTTLNGNENTVLTPGYYYWKDTSWQKFVTKVNGNVTTNGVIKDYLGYTADGIHNTTDVRVDGVAYTGIGCKQWTQAEGGNGHWYCAYSHGNISWQNAFNLGKSKKGYLVTILSTDEWKWVRRNLVDQTTGYNLRENIWIGYNKVDFKGNPTEFVWITGEKSKYLWTNTPETDSFFNGGEPNNFNGEEGCTHILGIGTHSERLWNDLRCDGTNNYGGSFNRTIIEFNQ